MYFEVKVPLSPFSFIFDYPLFSLDGGNFPLPGYVLLHRDQVDAQHGLPDHVQRALDEDVARELDVSR